MQNNRLRAKDVLREFPVSRSTLYRWAKEGQVYAEQLPGTKVIFFSRVAIQRRLKAMAVIALLLALCPSTFAAPQPAAPVRGVGGANGLSVVERVVQPGRGAARTGMASWYSRSSAMREGNSGVMANGAIMQDEAFTAASWDYPFGTRLRVMEGQKSIVVTVLDRGPSPRLYRQGRILDLSPAAFQALAPLSQGVIRVSVEPVP